MKDPSFWETTGCLLVIDSNSVRCMRGSSGAVSMAVECLRKGSDFSNLEFTVEQTIDVSNISFVGIADDDTCIEIGGNDETIYFWQDTRVEAEKVVAECTAKLNFGIAERVRATVWENACASGAIFGIVTVIGGLIIIGVNSEHTNSSPRMGRARAFKRLIELLGPTTTTIILAVVIGVLGVWVLKKMLVRPMKTVYRLEE